tara:strand:- start:18 stop:1385 length:1368 start_codon:yes stop_codon:yes gene_type:complete
MASTYLTNTFSSPTNNYKWTLSVWVKRSALGTNPANGNYIFQTYPSGQGYSRLYFDPTDKIQFDGEDTSQSNAFNLKTTRRFRDTNAWYHIVLKWDVTQGTASNRVKIYVNGVEEGNYGTETYPAQNTTYPINRDKLHNIGRHNSDTNTYFDGVMSHFHFTDGYSYDASTFGSTDSTTGEWKINTSPSITMGTNGFTILKDGMTITDQSSNSNNWTLANGTLTKTEDCPSNVFATFSPLNVPTSNAPNFAAGNTDLDSAGNAGLFHGSSTLGMSSGKFYAEFKWKSNNYAIAGVSSRARNDARENKRPGAENGSYGFELYNGNVKVNSNTLGGFSGSSLSIGDILCIAIDCDNNKLYFRKNGDAWMNSGDPTSGSTGTGAVSLTAATGGDYDGFWFFVIGDGDTSSSSKISANFGNGYFLTTAVSSAGTNASNNGIFEFDVPAGYTALSTKGLNE